MQYRTLGKTGLRVSALGYGAAALGGVYGAIDEAEGIRTVHAALAGGINYIDVAPYYGVTRAETLLGQALRTVPRDRYYLSTKVGRYDFAEFDFSANRVIQGFEESLRRLGVDHVDLLLCHDIEFGSIDQVVNETLPALERLRAAGKARWLGFSGLPLKIYPLVLDRTSADAVISYCHHTLQDTTLTGLLPYLKEKHVGVINASPLGMGLLSPRGVPPWHPAPVEVRAACAQAAAHCAARGSNLAKLALQFAGSHPDIASTLTGAASAAEVEENLAWHAEPPDRTLLDEVRALLQPIRDRSWPSGRPENN
ncbi:MAG: aldo/keto reductase [Planctomycetia bacterium]|nr:aldo/keto reductase [Planctomycetia bacterium]